MPRTVDSFRPGRTDEVPVLVHSAGPGPSVVITANVHGDEVTGHATCLLLDQVLPERLLRGSVAVFPTLNPEGLASRTRQLASGHDLNRLFPGHRSGTTGEKHAYAAWSAIHRQSPDVLVDLHSDSARSIPYAIVDRALKGGRGHGLEPRLRTLASASGLTVLTEYPEDLYVRYALDRSLAGAMVNRANLAAITLEVGPCGYIDDGSVNTMVDAVFGVLGELGVVDHESSPHASFVSGDWQRSTAPGVLQAGVFRPLLDAGEAFKTGQRLGVVLDPTGAVVDTLSAEHDGIVISWADRAWLSTGSSPGTLAQPSP